MDTGVFDDGRYWAVEVAYAKASPTELLAKITIKNHAAEEAPLSVLPTLWFRDTCGSTAARLQDLFLDGGGIAVDHPRLSSYRLDAAPTADGSRPQALFCDNETNNARGHCHHRLPEGWDQRRCDHWGQHGERRRARHEGVLVVQDHGSRRGTPQTP
jgi:hypothetical protein